MYIYVFIDIIYIYVYCSWFLPIGKILVMKSYPSSGENKKM